MEKNRIKRAPPQAGFNIINKGNKFKVNNENKDNTKENYISKEKIFQEVDERDFSQLNEAYPPLDDIL